MSRNYKRIISIVSGASADGLSAIIVKISKDLSFDITDSHSFEYPTEIKNLITKCARNQANTSEICHLNFVLGEIFAKCAEEIIKKSGIEKYNIDFISAQGQTIYHIPTEQTISGVSTRATLQIGDISVISERTGILTVGDFSSKDIAAGGQGAPLAPFADEIIFGRKKNRGILNINNITNITVLSPSVPTFAFDIGPGNIFINYFTKMLFNKDIDFNGKIASQGNIDEQLLRFMMTHEYYSKCPPKLANFEIFDENYAQQVYKNAIKVPSNIITTVTAQCAYAIYDAYKKFIEPKVELEEIVLGGDGASNDMLKTYLSRLLPNILFTTHIDYGIDNNFKEALAYAYLGYMTLGNKCNNIPGATGARHGVCMGKISY